MCSVHSGAPTPEAVDIFHMEGGDTCIGLSLYNLLLRTWRQRSFSASGINTLRPGHNGRRFADDILKCILLNEDARISVNISLKFIPKDLMNYIPALIQIMAWHRPGDKPLSEPVLISLLTHICVSRLQWVNLGNVLYLCIHTTNAIYQLCFCKQIS